MPRGNNTTPESKDVRPVNPYDEPKTEPAALAAATMVEGAAPSAPISTGPANPGNAPTHRDVIVQRPHDVTEEYFFIGHNDFTGQFKYDTPISLPTVVIDHMRTIKRVSHRPGPDGQIQGHMSNAFAVMDA